MIIIIIRVLIIERMTCNKNDNNSSNKNDNNSNSNDS